MFVYIIAVHDKNSFDMLDELRSKQDQTSPCGQAIFSKHRTATLPVFQPFYYFLLIILLSSDTRPHYLPVDDSLILHADHF